MLVLQTKTKNWPKKLIRVLNFSHNIFYVKYQQLYGLCLSNIGKKVFVLVNLFAKKPILHLLQPLMEFLRQIENSAFKIIDNNSFMIWASWIIWYYKIRFKTKRCQEHFHWIICVWKNLIFICCIRLHITHFTHTNTIL